MSDLKFIETIIITTLMISLVPIEVFECIFNVSERIICY